MAHRNDVIMPIRARFGSASSPMVGVDQLFTRSGYRHANRFWETPLRSLSLNYRLSTEESYDILETFNSLYGPFDTFLARDWSDWHTAEDNDMRNEGVSGTSHIDMPLMNPNLSPISNIGDGSTTVFHTYKRYQKGAAAILDERIRHPISDANFKVGNNGVLQTGGGADYTLTENGGIVTFSSPPGGSPTETLTWGGSFYRAVHFLSEQIQTLMEFKDAYSYSGIVLQEARGI